MKHLAYYVGIFAVLIAFIPFLALPKTLADGGQDGKNSQNGENFHFDGQTVGVFNCETQKVMQVNLEEYLVGVVAAEMPAAFETEALKAQAVAARTFIVKKVADHNAPEQHAGAAVCTDSTHCKAWLSKDDLKKTYGKNFDEYYSKVAQAVLATQGEIVVYQGQPITAVFHSMSGGRTENAKDVWGGDVPYLVSVDSPGDILSPKYETTADFTLEEFKEKILAAKPDAVVDSYNDIGDIVRSEAGGVKTIIIGGQEFTGAEMRTMFGLRSANFSLSQVGENLRFTVHGYGHGVGMSQYGANYFAQMGRSYKEILKIYYQGTDLQKM